MYQAKSFIFMTEYFSIQFTSDEMMHGYIGSESVCGQGTQNRALKLSTPAQK
jgi:hypothetical protein